MHLFFAEFISRINKNVFEVALTSDVVVSSMGNSSGYLARDTAEFSVVAAEITIIVSVKPENCFHLVIIPYETIALFLREVLW